VPAHFGPADAVVGHLRLLSAFWLGLFGSTVHWSGEYAAYSSFLVFLPDANERNSK
jgi:hypothetical protein